MRINDFKILGSLPENYEYEIFPQENDSILILGKQDSNVIGFILVDHKLHQINFEEKKEHAHARINEK